MSNNSSVWLCCCSVCPYIFETALFEIHRSLLIRLKAQSNGPSTTGKIGGGSSSRVTPALQMHPLLMCWYVSMYVRHLRYSIPRTTSLKYNLAPDSDKGSSVGTSITGLQTRWLVRRNSCLEQQEVCFTVSIALWFQPCREIRFFWTPPKKKINK